jgi:hypothetical protein
MQINNQILLLILGIIIIHYAFMTLQWVLGIVAAVIIIFAILLAPHAEQWIKSL